MSNQPLTKEQVWGVPENTSQEELPATLCPYTKIECSAWDGKAGCQAEICVISEAGNGTFI